MEYLQGDRRQYGGSSDGSAEGNEYEREQYYPHRYAEAHAPASTDMHSARDPIMSCTWPSEDPLDVMYIPNTGDVWLRQPSHCVRPAQSEVPCSITIEFGYVPQHVVKMDMTTSAQYLEVYVGHRTLNGDLRFVFGETAFGVPDQHVPGRFRLDYACPDSPPFQSIAAISFKFAEIGDDAVLALDAFRLTTQSVYPTTSSQLSPQVRVTRAHSWRPSTDHRDSHGTASMTLRSQKRIPPTTRPHNSPHHLPDAELNLSTYPPSGHSSLPSRHPQPHHHSPRYSNRHHPSRGSVTHAYPPSHHRHHHHPPPLFVDPTAPSKSFREDAHYRQSSLSPANSSHIPLHHSALNRQSPRPRHPSSPRPPPPNHAEGLSAMNTILELQKKMLEDLETRICAAVDLQLNQVLQRLDAAEAIVDDLTTRVDSIHQDKDIVFAGIMHRLNKLDTGIIQLRSAQVQTTKAVQSAIQNVKQSVAAQRNSQSDADDSSSLSTSSLHSVQWQQLNPSPP
ncbi:hypothetical protein H310_11345 [Aphanomyces invadans]|uniref:Uncharacterized protein n=1 Tax=Aphanomyces invadans TaxID=157072 RepID=A0A024TLL1_9STRA|nr:hypothetical protein H310_11345 [Aphanomyces invadans]ETV95045.1 hypothetical protein H310_11345 [Aphanomyces invadans]|eukprot:XP_008876218.1 hypothetical protein H310_11345 [Aphanomyces invadans]